MLLCWVTFTATNTTSVGVRSWERKYNFTWDYQTGWCHVWPHGVQLTSLFLFLGKRVKLPAQRFSPLAYFCMGDKTKREKASMNKIVSDVQVCAHFILHNKDCVVSAVGCLSFIYFVIPVFRCVFPYKSLLRCFEWRVAAQTLIYTWKKHSSLVLLSALNELNKPNHLLFLSIAHTDTHSNRTHYDLFPFPLLLCYYLLLLSAGTSSSLPRIAWALSIDETLLFVWIDPLLNGCTAPHMKDNGPWGVCVWIYGQI